MEGEPFFQCTLKELKTGTVEGNQKAARSEVRQSVEYPARFVRDKETGGFVVTFPDVREAITEGESLEEAMRSAEEALELALTFYVEASKDLPPAGAFEKGDADGVSPPSE